MADRRTKKGKIRFKSMQAELFAEIRKDLAPARDRWMMKFANNGNPRKEY